MPKTVEDLEQSRKIRQYLLSEFGLIPESVMTADWSIKTMRSGRTTLMDKRKTGKNWGTVFSISDSARGTYHSDFPHNICRFCINFYCPKTTDSGYFSNGLATVFDPFAGHNSRMEDVFLCGRNYVANDLSHKFMEYNREIAQKLQKQSLPLGTIPILEVHEGDSRYLDFPANSFDFAITSPPFWDIEDYGPEPEQLSEQKTFHDFMYALEKVFRHVHRFLKKDAFFVVECNDFRRFRIFYPYHYHVIQALLIIGFVIHDVIICDYVRSQVSSFTTELDRLKITGKRHSYFIVVRKQEQYILELEPVREHRDRIEVQADKEGIQASIITHPEEQIRMVL